MCATSLSASIATPFSSDARHFGRSRRCSSSTIFLLPPIARRRRSRLNFVRSVGAARASWSSSVPPTSPGPMHADRDGLRRQIEARVHGADRARHVLGVDDGRDVALGRALRDRAHVDAGDAQACRKTGPRCPGRPAMSSPTTATMAQALRDADALHLPFAELDGERALDDRTHLLRGCLRARRSRSSARSCLARSASPTRRRRAARRTADRPCPERRSFRRPRGSRARPCRRR